MTIAAGFVCIDGIVLCADTQETTGYTKNNTEKISSIVDQGLGIAISGAGDTELIETIGAQIQRDLLWGYSPKELRMTNEVRDIIQNVMSSSFKRYIVPYAAFPKEDRPWCDLLIVVTVKNEANNYDCLFRASGTTVRSIEPGGECVGTGLILAKSLIERFYNPFMDLDELVLAACYIMFQTKKWVDGCGGKTDLLVASYKKDFFGGIASRDIESIEQQFEQCEESVNLLITDLLNPNRTSDRIESLISHAKMDGENGLKRLYPEGSQLLKTLKRLAPERPTPPNTPSNSQT